MAGSARGGHLRSGLAFICACLAIALALPALVLVEVGQELLQPAVYKDALISQNAYQRLPELAAQQIVYASGTAALSDPAFVASVFDSPSSSLSSCLEGGFGPSAYSDLRASARPPTPAELGQIKSCLRAGGAPATVSQTVDGMPVYFWVLTESDWDGVLTALLPPDWVRTQVESVVDQFFGTLASGQGDAVVHVSLVDVKTRLEGPEGLAAVEQLIAAQPSCSLDQLGKIVTIATSGAPLGEVPVCRPPDAVVPIMSPSIQSALTLLAGLIPNTTEVDLTGGSSGGQNPLVPAHDFFDLTRGAAVAGVGLAVLLWLLAVALGARSVGSALRWLGVPLAVVGAAELALAVAGQAIVHGVVTDRLPSSLNESGIGPALAALEVDSLNWIVTAFFGRMGIQAFLLLAVGLTLVGASAAARIFARPVGASRIDARSQPQR
jgi:hypothetical protein